MPIIRISGFQSESTETDIVNFLSQDKTIKIAEGAKGRPAVHLIKSFSGAMVGPALIELVDDLDVTAALKLDRQELPGTIRERDREDARVRFARIAVATSEDLVKHKEYMEAVANDPVVRVNNLSFKTSQEDLVSLFEGLQIAENGIRMVADEMGRFGGIAFVKFQSITDAKKATEKSKQSFLDRMVFVNASTSNQMANFVKKPREERSGEGFIGGRRDGAGSFGSQEVRFRRSGEQQQSFGNNSGGFDRRTGGAGGFDGFEQPRRFFTTTATQMAMPAMLQATPSSTSGLFRLLKGAQPLIKLAMKRI